MLLFQRSEENFVRDKKQLKTEIPAMSSKLHFIHKPTFKERPSKMDYRWGQIADYLAAFYQIIFAPFLWIVLVGHAFFRIRQTPEELKVCEYCFSTSSVSEK